MKNNIFVLILICLVSGFITAQNDSNAALSIQRAKSDFGNRSASTFQKYCRELLDSDAKAMNSPILKLYPRIKSKGGSMIEGMETVTSSVIELQLIIKNDITKDKVEWSNSFSASGSNINKIVLDSLNEMFEMKSSLDKEILDFVNNYVDQEFNKNCKVYIERAKAKSASGDHLRALQIASVIPEGSSCNAEASKLVKESYDQYQSELCGKNLHEAQLEAAAGRYNRAISKLYCISYDAPCAGEALVVAKQISESSKSNLRADDQGAISNIVLYLDDKRNQNGLPVSMELYILIPAYYAQLTYKQFVYNHIALLLYIIYICI